MVVGVVAVAAAAAVVNESGNKNFHSAIHGNSNIIYKDIKISKIFVPGSS